MPSKSAITAQHVDAICELLQDGESLRAACAKVGVAKSTFLKAIDGDKDWGDRYARARATGADVEFERLRDIVEEPPPIDANGKTDSGWVAWKKLQIDTFKWQLAKKRPERYGDRIEQVHSGNVGLSISIDLGGKA